MIYSVEKNLYVTLPKKFCINLHTVRYDRFPLRLGKPRREIYNVKKFPPVQQKATCQLTYLTLCQWRVQSLQTLTLVG